MSLNSHLFIVNIFILIAMLSWTCGIKAGGYPLLNYTPASLLNPTDGFTSSALFNSDSSNGWAINSTTLANGSNPTQSWLGDPVNLATGNLYHNERDISVPGRGLPLVFERNYNSRGAAANNGPLGYGWTHSFNHRLNFYGVDASYVKVGWLDGTGNERFYRLAGSTIPAGSTFQSAPGVFSTLKRTASGTWTVTEKNGLTYNFAANAGTTAGTIASLSNITDRNGNTLTLSYNADNTLNTVTDGPGRALAFVYTSGLVTQINVKAISGALLSSTQYGYDSNGNLNSYKSPLAVAGTHNPVSYGYYTAANGTNLNHAMKSYTLPQGEGMQFAYYTDGRVFQHQRGNNGALLPETTTFRYQDFRHQTVTVNELGNSRTHTFDANGNPISIIDETGATYSYTYDPANPFNRLTETDPNGLVTQYQYDSLGNVIKITQPNAATTQYLSFTSFNAPQVIKDALGNYTLLNYDSKGNLTDSLKLITGFVPTVGATPAFANIAAWRKQAYDGVYGQLTQSKTLRNYTGSTLGTFAPASGTDPEGPTFTTTYDANTLYPTQISRLGDKNGDGLINSQDPPDNATLSFDSLGRQTQGIDRDWQTVINTYDADSRPLTGTDAAGQQRNFAYDGDGRLTGNELELTQNNQTQLWDSAYRSYDTSGRLQQTLDAGGNAMQYQYDAAGNLLQITDPDSYTLGFSYDAANRWIKAADKANHAVSRTLDASGRIKTSTDANGNTTTYSYYGATQNGRLKLVTLPTVSGFTTGLIRQFNYDALGHVTQATDTPATPATGSSLASRNTLSTHNALGQLVRVAGPQVNDSDPSSSTYNTTIRTVTLYSYDNLGQLLSIQAGKTTSDGGASINPDTGSNAGDSLTTQVSYVQDDFGRTLTETDANGIAATYKYDINNNVLTANTANGHTLTYTWGYGHQQQSMSAEDGRNVQYTRNPLGQIANVETWSATGTNGASNPDIAYYYSYDASHRLANVTDTRAYKTLSYSWSPGGLLNSLTDSDWNSTNYLYDPVGRLTSVWAANYDGYSFAYDNGGRLTQVVYPNGISQTQSWNADNTLAQISHQNGGAIIEQSTYGYDGLGRRQSNQETLSGTTLSYAYSYDALDRLNSVSNGTATQTETYGYDRFGNRVQKQIGSPAASTYAYLYDAANQLTETHQTNTAGTLLEAYLYDNSGNETRKCSGTGVSRPTTPTVTCTGGTVQSYVYNSFNRLSQYNGAITGNYLYDHQGRRIQKIEGTNALNYLYDGKNIYEEFLTSSWSPANALYVQAGTDHPLARLIGTVGAPTANAAYYHQDGIGSVLATTSGSKSVSATQRFNAFGNNIGGSGTVPEYGYTGREPDASGLIFYRARYYDPNQIRFTQRDPLGIAAGINQYAYVGNNPINFNDPSGLLANQVGNWWNTQGISYVAAAPTINQNVVNAVAGFGDGVSTIATLGYYSTADIRNSLGIGGVNQNSASYTGGNYAGYAWGAGIGVTALASAYAVPSTLYHFTSAEAAASIAGTGINAGSGLFGAGVYGSSINSGLAATLMGAASTETSVAISTAGLTVYPTLIPGAFRIIGGVSLANILGGQ